MMTRAPLVFKIAAEPWEFEQIHRLNYRTFVEEIPQHQPNHERALVDAFHAENTYLICLRGQQLLGMVTVRDKRPFSLDKKLANLDDYLPPHRSICEVRLLAIEQDHRSPLVFQGLMRRLAETCEQRGYDLAIMSGTVRALRLYRHLGFTPFGPLVGPPEAQYQPMYLTLAAYQELKRKVKMLSRLMPQR